MPPTPKAERSVSGKPLNTSKTLARAAGWWGGWGGGVRAVRAVGAEVVWAHIGSHTCKTLARAARVVGGWRGGR